MSAEDPSTSTNEFPTARGLAEGRPVGGGRYILKQFLGQGGMGLVWLAKDSRLGDDVALKFLPSELRLDPTALDDLRSETLKSRKLAHPHIIRIHDLFEGKNEDPFISMEYVDGPTLSKRRVQQPSRVLEWEELSRLVRQLCEALEYAHNEQVIHRDLKPANLMLDSRQRIKLADFGIARVVTDSFSRITMRHGTSGTLVYMSPQQLDGRPSNPTDDIYSVGATLYELLTSKPPFFTGEIAHQIRYVIADPVNERLHQLRIMSEVPAMVSETICSCLAKNPSERPQNARELSDRLGLTRGTSPSSKSRREKTEAAPESHPPSAAPDAPAAKPPIRFLWPALLIGTAAIATLSSFYLGKHASPNILTTQTGGANTNLIATAPATNGNSAAPNKATTLTPTVPLVSPPTSTIIAPIPTPPIAPPSNNTATAAATNTPAPPPAKPAPILASFTPPAAAPAPSAPKFPQAGRPWTNSLDMRFAPIPGTAALFSVWDTRVSDFAQFAEAAQYTNDAKWKNPEFAAVSSNPVVYVNFEDATNFCAWLTDKERALGALSANQFYRLPTDLEWSRAVGLGDEDARTPKDRSDGIRKSYTWGAAWPPPAGAGNFAGKELEDKPMLAVRVIPHYEDAFTRLAPVGSFGTNLYGLFDMAGNVKQWCADEYDPPSPERVLRGSAWDTADNVELLLSHRDSLGPLYRQANVGFRCVLDTGSADASFH